MQTAIVDYGWVNENAKAKMRLYNFLIVIKKSGMAEYLMDQQQ